MHQCPLLTLPVLLLLLSTPWPGVSLDTANVTGDPDSAVGGPHCCPSFCDTEGYLHTGKCCVFNKAPYCCELKEELVCCSNITYKVKDTVEDEYNCHPDLTWFSIYWKTILGVCLPLATISVVGAVTLCSIQHIRTRRRQRHREAMERDRSNSAISSISGSSYSSRTTTTTGPPPSPIVVTSSRHPDSPDMEVLRTYGVRYPLQPPPYVDKPPGYDDIFI